jgi:hypothetical protein
MLLTKRKAGQRRLLSTTKARQGAAAEPGSAVPLDHEKQLAVVDAIEWAAERWADRDVAAQTAPDPKSWHAARLIAALTYLDARFDRLDPTFVTQVIDGVTSEPALEGARLDAKAAAALLAVEVGAFRR